MTHCFVQRPRELGRLEVVDARIRPAATDKLLDDEGDATAAPIDRLDGTRRWRSVADCSQQPRNFGAIQPLDPDLFDVVLPLETQHQLPAGRFARQIVATVGTDDDQLRP